MTTTLAHRCLRGRQCGDRETTPDGRQLGAATEAPDSLCAACERRTGRAVAELPRLYAELETIVGQHRAAGEHVSGTRELPTPPRLDVLVLQADIDAVVTAWAQPVASRCRIPWDVPRVRRLRPGPRVHRAAHILASNLDALLRLPVATIDVWTVDHGVISVKASGMDGALRLLRLHQRGRQLVTGGTGDVRLPVPCPDCEGPLVRRNGADQVDCMTCDNRWPEKDYRLFCLAHADHHRPASRGSHA